MGDYLTIGQVARLVGRCRETLLRYEQKGIITPARRDPVNNRRIYTQGDVAALIARLRPEPRE